MSAIAYWKKKVPELTSEVLRTLTESGRDQDLLGAVREVWRTNFESETSEDAWLPDPDRASGNVWKPALLKSVYMALHRAWGGPPDVGHSAWKETFNQDENSLVVDDAAIGPGDRIRIRGEDEPREVDQILGNQVWRAVFRDNDPVPTGPVIWRLESQPAIVADRVVFSLESSSVDDITPECGPNLPRCYGPPPPTVLPALPQGGGDPVVRLAEFLKGLDPLDLQDLIEEGRDKNMTGSDEAVLQEQCLRKSPLDLIRDLLSKSQMKQVLSSRNLPTEGKADELAKNILRALGFTVSPPIHGPHQILESLRECHMAALSHDSLKAVSSAVQEGARDLERALKMFLRFQAEHLFQQPIDLLVQERGWLNEPVQPIRNASLGTLVAATHQMARELGADSEGAAAARYAARYKDRPLMPDRDALAELARLRNLFAHDRTESPTVEDGRKFLLLARNLMEHWCGDDPPLLPRVVELISARTDEWGRTRLEMRTDAATTEYVYTDRPLEPGQHYFMLAHSNPIRMFPLMVPVGDTD
ncbi:MAG: hypothetical protein V2A76_01430 [Planctomycetota bacterium]